MKRFLLSAGGLLASMATVLAQTTGNDAVTEVGKQTTLLGMVAAAGWVMIPLALASMITLTLIIYCFFTLTEKTIVTPELLDRIEPFFENEDVEGLAAYVAEQPQATARIVDRTLQFLGRHPDADAESIRIVAETEGNRIAASLNLIRESGRAESLTSDRRRSPPGQRLAALPGANCARSRPGYSDADTCR